MLMSRYPGGRPVTQLVAASSYFSCRSRLHFERQLRCSLRRLLRPPSVSNIAVLGAALRARIQLEAFCLLPAWPTPLLGPSP